MIDEILQQPRPNWERKDHGGYYVGLKAKDSKDTLDRMKEYRNAPQELVDAWEIQRNNIARWAFGEFIDTERCRDFDSHNPKTCEWCWEDPAEAGTNTLYDVVKEYGRALDNISNFGIWIYFYIELSNEDALLFTTPPGRRAFEKGDSESWTGHPFDATHVIYRHKDMELNVTGWGVVHSLQDWYADETTKEMFEWQQPRAQVKDNWSPEKENGFSIAQNYIEDGQWA